MVFDKSITHWAMTWDEVQAACDSLISDIKSRMVPDWAPDHIIAITKGGLIPAAIIWQTFPTARFHTLGVSSYSTAGKKTPQFDTHSLGLDLGKWNNPQTLIIDDICDSGDTFRLLDRYMSDAMYGCMLARYAPEDQYEYDFMGRSVENGVWVDFPWERAPEEGEVEVPF